MAETETEFIEAINAYKTKPWSTVGRQEVLDEVLNDVENAKKIAAELTMKS